MLLQLNRDSFQTGDRLVLDAGVSVTTSSQPRADIYLALVLPAGDFYCLRDDLSFGPANRPLPLLRDWQVREVSPAPVFSLALPAGVEPGRYEWWLVLIKPGAPVADPSSWLGSAHLPWEVRPAAAVPETVRSPRERELNPRATPAQVASLVNGGNNFACRLYRQLAREPGNLFFSPYSVSQALAMAWGGARGDTAAQMATVLGLDDVSRPHDAFNALSLELAARGSGVDADGGEKFRLELANSLWGQRGFPLREDYLELLAVDYDAGIHLVDFAGAPLAAGEMINRWVEERTAGRIRDLIAPGSLAAATRLVIANAVYFRAGWSHPFDADATTPAIFHLSSGRRQEVETMSVTGNFPYLSRPDCQVVELPYYGDELAMVIILPAAGLAAWEPHLDASEIVALTAAMTPARIRLFLPRFQFSWGTRSLRDALQALGMTAAFDPGQADFSGMDGRRDLFVGDVLHQAFVAVDEKGTEAAAATAVTMEVTGIMPAAPVVVRVNRPFIFLVRDRETGAVLFLGRVENPAS